MSTFTTNQMMQQYSNIVSEYLAKGYIIKLGESSSYSNVDNYIALINPANKNEQIRIWLLGDSRSISHEYTTLKCISVRIYESMDHTCWPSKGTEVYSKTFYEIERGKFYTDSLEEYEQYIAIKSARYTYRRDSLNGSRRNIDISKIPESLINKFMSRIHEIRGMKRAKSTCIRELFAQRLHRNGQINYYLSFTDNKDRVQTIIFS